MNTNDKYKLHPDLLEVLLKIEGMGYTVEILGWGRDLKKHVQIYKDIAIRKRELFDIDDVPLGSRHLPCFETSDLRAVDIRVLGTVDSYGVRLTGDQIHALVTECRDPKVFHGIGIGKHMLHLDCCRTHEPIPWRY